MTKSCSPMWETGFWGRGYDVSSHLDLNSLLSWQHFSRLFLLFSLPFTTSLPSLLSFSSPSSPLLSRPLLYSKNHNWCRDAQYSIDSSDNNAHADTHFSRTARTLINCTVRWHANLCTCFNSKGAQIMLSYCGENDWVENVKLYWFSLISAGHQQRWQRLYRELKWHHFRVSH